MVDPCYPSGGDPQLIELPDGRPCIGHVRENPESDLDERCTLFVKLWKPD